MKGKRIAQRWMAMLTILVMVIGCLGLQTPVTDAYAATTGMSVVCGSGQQQWFSDRKKSRNGEDHHHSKEK